MKKVLLTSAVALAVFSACSKMDYEGNDHQGTTVDVRANIKGMTTRLSNGVDWDTDDAFGVSGGTSNTNIKRTYSSSGAWEGDNVYVLGTNEVEFTAYYPFTGTEGEDPGKINFKLVDADNNYVGDDEVDFMWAKATASTGNPTATFEFSHKMSKISLAFSDGSSTKADETTQEVKYTLSNVAVDGTFNTATGEVTAGEKTGTIVVTTAMGETSSVIVPSETTSSTASEITLTIETGGKTYEGTISPSLTAAYQYDYTVTISSSSQKTGITISTSSVKGWTSATEEAKAVVITEKEVPNTLEVGDFLLADGTVIDKDADITDQNVVGVVFYVGKTQPSELYTTEGYVTYDCLKNDYPDCNNGFALSLTETESTAFAADATSDYSLTTWYADNTSKGIYPAGYNNTIESDKNTRTYLLGYNNTSLWKSFASSNTSLDVTALTKLAEFQNDNAVTNASTWFIMSAGEFALLLDYSSGTGAVVDAIKTSLAKVNGTEITKSTYWSSTYGKTNSNSEETSMTIGTKIGDTASYFGLGTAALNKTYKFRYAIAF